MKRRLLSTFLCLCMALTLLPAPAWAAEGTTISVDGTTKTLAAAISEAAAGDTLQLTASFTQPRNNGVTISKDLTLDLNGQTITYNGLNSSLITVSGCTLTVTDSGENGAIQTTEANYVFYLENSGKLVVNGGTLSSPNGSSLIWNASNGMITINGGTVSASGRSYGTIFSGSGSRGTIAVTGGTVQATGEDGRAISSDSGAVTVSGGTVEATGNDGKAIDKSSTTGTITVSGGIVRTTTGPAIYQRSYGPIVIKGGTVTSANTGAKSGTIYFATAPRNPQRMLTITDGTVENTAGPDEGYSVYFGRDPYMGGEVTSETLYGYYSHTGGTVGRVYPEPPPHTHAVSVDCETDSGEQVTFLPLTSQDGKLYIDGRAAQADSYYVLPAGHYYLADDVRLDKNIYTTASTENSVLDLCLNGYKLEYAGDGDKNVIFVGRLDQAFNLCDCNPTGKDHTANVIEDPVSGYTRDIRGGVITGGARAAINQPGNAPVTLYGGTIAGNDSSAGTSRYGGGVYANHVVMHGGTIMYNKATYGGGVYAIKSFTMTGGEISHNWAGTEGGVNLGDSATATLSGNAVIADNEAGTAKAPSNLCLGTGSIVTVAPEGLGQNAGVGVTTSTAPTDASPVTVAVAGEGDALTADDLAKFSSDNSDYELKLSEGSIVLAKPAPYAITTQPTVANGYTVTASYPEKAHYQWYRSGDSNGIGAKITSEGAAFGSAAEGANYDGSNGHWSGTAKNGVCEFFTLNLKAGQLVYLGFENGYKGKTFTLTGDNGQRVTATPAVSYLYLPVPADGSYTLRISGLISTSATLFNANLYPPLAGQTGAALVPAKGGSHFCLVTWDGTDQYERSDSVTPVIATTALALEPETLTLQVGQTEYLEVTRTPSGANDDVTWASDNEGVATVNNSGRVKAVSVGTATITATANGITASCAVTVTPVPAITQQPTAENKYTVGVNYAPEGISYQWYPATVTTADITPENADPFTEDGDPTNLADGKWAVAEGDWYDGYFTTALKKGDVVAVTMTTAEKPNEGVLGLIYENDDHGESYYLGYYFSDFEPDEGVTAAEKDGSTVITYVTPADGSYDLVFSGGAAPVISAKLTHTQLGEAVSGQTTAKLTATQAGDYLCRVTWPDGTVLDSDVVAYVPPDPGGSKGEVEVKPDTPAVSVDEEDLKELAGEVSDGDTVTVKLTVEKQAEPVGKDEIDQLVTGNKDDVLYLDLSLVKQVNGGTPEAITDTGDKVLEIVVPYDFTGKKDVTVYRKHGDTPAQALTKAGTKAEGTYRLDESGGKIYIYASKFSTYAIGYAVKTSDTPGPTPPYNPAVAAICPRDSTCPISKFTDTDATQRYHDGVHYCLERGLMEGTSGKTFSPGLDTSRAMVATILWRLEGTPEHEAEPIYPDCAANRWYARAVAWAGESGVVEGYDSGSFGPDDPITLEQLAVMLWRYAGEPASNGALDRFTDRDKAGRWAIDALRWAVKEGILTGRDGDILDPTGRVTRAEIAAIFQRFCERERSAADR